MDFKEMSEHMTERELYIVLKIIYPYAKPVHFIRVHGLNFITVYFHDSTKIELFQVDFLPDDIYIYDAQEDEILDGKPLKNGTILHKYRQFMIAKGYSEIWLDNPYVM